jgi:N-acetylglucosamine-6-phosphate deacetylase
LVKWGICDVGNAIALATTAPRHALGLPDGYIGQTANLLRWHYGSVGGVAGNENRALSYSRLD